MPVSNEVIDDLEAMHGIKILVPTFEIATNPTISLADAKAAKIVQAGQFHYINGFIDSAYHQPMNPY